MTTDRLQVGKNGECTQRSRRSFAISSSSRNDSNADPVDPPAWGVVIGFLIVNSIDVVPRSSALEHTADGTPPCTPLGTPPSRVTAPPSPPSTRGTLPSRVPSPASASRWSPWRRSPKLGPPKLGPPKLGPPELGPPKFGPPELGPPELGPPELWPLKLGPPKLGPPKLGPPKLGPPKFRPPWASSWSHLSR